MIADGRIRPATPALATAIAPAMPALATATAPATPTPTPTVVGVPARHAIRLFQRNPPRVLGINGMGGTATRERAIRQPRSLARHGNREIPRLNPQRLVARQPLAKHENVNVVPPAVDCHKAHKRVDNMAWIERTEHDAKPNPRPPPVIVDVDAIVWMVVAADRNLFRHQPQTIGRTGNEVIARNPPHPKDGVVAVVVAN